MLRYRGKDRGIDNETNSEKYEILNKPTCIQQMINDINSACQQWKNYGLFTKCYWSNWMFKWKEVKHDLYFRLYTKINSRWIVDIHMASKYIEKLLELISYQQNAC